MKKNEIVVQPPTFLMEMEAECPLFITDYDPKYCQLLLEYAYNNFDIDGFYADYMILPETSELWAEKFPEWKNCITMAPYKIKSAINQAQRLLTDLATGIDIIIATPDGKSKLDVSKMNLDLLQKIIFRTQDMGFKIEKDTGLLKYEGLEKVKKLKSSKSNKNDMDEDITNMIKSIADINRGIVRKDDENE